MQTVLRYGRHGSLALDLPSSVAVVDCARPRGAIVDDPVAAVEAALDAPLGFPPLAQAVVPGDRVAVAIEPGVPQAALVVAGVVRTLCRAGVAASEITIVRSRGDAQADLPDPRSALEEPLRSAVGLETHSPDLREHLMYLAATPAGRPIYLNRSLCDADLVVPIGCLRCREALDYHGVHGSLYPTFSDAKTQQRYRSPRLLDTDDDVQYRAQHEVDVVGWLAGTHFAVQVLPGPDGALAAVLAGDAEEVSREGQRQCQALWRQEVPERASLVIAGIPGDAGQQTWENVGRAIAAALRLVVDEGAIVLCTELAALPGAGMQTLGGNDDRAASLARIGKQRPEDTVPAWELAQAQQRSRVYLLSQLDEVTVEELGIAPVSAAAEVARLASRHRSCIVLGNAQYAFVTATADREA